MLVVDISALVKDAPFKIVGRGLRNLTITKIFKETTRRGAYTILRFALREKQSFLRRFLGRDSFC